MATNQLIFIEIEQRLRTFADSAVSATEVGYTLLYSFEKGRFYVVSGQILYLESVKTLAKGGNGSVDGRTRCIYENGMESDILLQTLRKNVVGDGYAITETEEEKTRRFFANNDIKEGDKVTGCFM